MGQHADIGTFGDVAAEEDDSILSYFVKTDAVSQIQNGDAIVVLGRKGAGKTALAKFFSEPRKDLLTISLSLRDYPWGMHESRCNLGASEIETYVSSWRYLIAIKTLSLLLQTYGMKPNSDAQRSAHKFLFDNYGGANPALGDILQPQRLKLSKSSFSPSFMGASIGAVEFERASGGVGPEIDTLTESLVRAAHDIISQTGAGKVLLHFDELDQGLSVLNEQHQKMIVGLVLACRSYLRSNTSSSSIFPVAYLRTDIWEEFRFSDKNKISQSSSILLEWTSETLLELINERIKVKLGKDKSWSDIDDGYLMRGSQSKWGHIVSRTFLRPRDVIQFLNCALSISIERLADADTFDNEDIQLAREPYSRYLKLELDDELGPHWEKWTEALQACSQIATITFQRDQFVEAYARRKSARNLVDADQALALLYQFSIIGYRGGIGAGGSSWIFQYSDPHAGWDSGASLLKVHLGLKEYAKLREERAA